MLHKIQPAEHGPLGEPMAHAVQTCVHCGFCLAACPTYREMGEEMDTPRGRIVLMKQVLEGELSLESALPHIDACLGCLSCEPACPSGVPYRDLLSPFRAITAEKRKRSLLEKIRRAMVSATLPYPARFRAAVLAGRIGRFFAPLMPKSFKPMLDLLPSTLPPAQRWPEINPARGQRRARVALLIGCAQQVLEPDINTATIEVLTRNGVEVIVPPSQSCCGALAWHVGDLPQARKFARQNLAAFPADVDAIITNAAGCGSGLHEYHLMLKGTPDEQRAETFRHRVCDVSVFLQRLGNLEPVPDSGQRIRIAYHDACHLANAQGVRMEPRALILMIPGVEILEIADPHLCCGSAGTYNIDQPAIAASLGSSKAKSILATQAELVATGNIGCLTQLKLHLHRLGSPVPIRHTIQILRDAYAGKI